MKTSQLTGAALDWAVAKCEGVDIDKFFDAWVPDPVDPHFSKHFQPSTNWSQGGPIIEREKIGIGWEHNETICVARVFTPPQGMWVVEGPTPLIAAMRCYVGFKLGDDIEIPEELK